MLPGLIHTFPLLVEHVVLLSQCARFGQMFSWRVAMSTFTLFSLLLMTTVFLASPMFSRFSARLVFIAQTFQIPSFRASLFCCFVLPDTKFPVCDSDFSYSPCTQRGRRTVAGQHYWLGAAQLLVASICPVSTVFSIYNL